MNIPSFYPVLLFLHVLGGIGVFVGLAIEWMSFRRLEGAGTRTAALPWMGMLRSNARLTPLAMSITLGAGIWMMVVQWGPQPWIHASFLGLAIMGALGGAVTSRRMRRLGAMLGSEAGPQLPSSFRGLRSGKALRVSLRLRIAVGLGILALMTLKPDTLGSVVVLGAAITAGLGTSLSFDATRAAEAPAARPVAGRARGETSPVS
jgi:hypothetical protein